MFPKTPRPCRGEFVHGVANHLRDEMAITHADAVDARKADGIGHLALGERAGRNAEVDDRHRIGRASLHAHEAQDTPALSLRLTFRSIEPRRVLAQLPLLVLAD